eukprot:gene13724-18412_t
MADVKEISIIQVEKKKSPSISLFGLYLFGISTVIAGNFGLWNEGLAHGYWLYFVVFCIQSLGFISLTLCQAELSSALSFSGGSYGFIRALQGPLSGYLVGCTDLMYMILYSSIISSLFGKCMLITTGISDKYEPFYWILFYTTTSFFQVIGDHWFWMFILPLSIFSISLILLFIIGNLTFSINHSHYESDNNYSNHNSNNNHNNNNYILTESIRVLPLTAWFFLGTNTLHYLSDIAIQTKKNIPASMIYVTLSISFIAISQVNK